jgi:hypothetical protein
VDISSMLSPGMRDFLEKQVMGPFLHTLQSVGR